MSFANLFGAMILMIHGALSHAAMNPPPLPMTAIEAVEYLRAHRDHLAMDPKLEAKLTRWALRSLGAALMTPSLRHLPAALESLKRHRRGLPTLVGHRHFYAFGLMGLIGAYLTVSSVIELKTILVDLHGRPSFTISLHPRSLNHFLDLDPDLQLSWIRHHHAFAAKLIELAEVLRDHEGL